MEHYVPVSLENFTRKEIEKEIENIVNAANLWCRGNMTSSEGIGREGIMMLRLREYATEFDNYRNSNSFKMSMASLLLSNDFVKCVIK